VSVGHRDQWELVNPEGACRPASLRLPPRPTSLEGKTVGLAWNGKPGGEHALDEIARLLGEQVPSVRFIRYWEEVPDSVSPRELNARVIQAMADRQPDVVLVSQGD
jgi:hypothetical protein